MGDRFSIVFLHNNRFVYEIYDHWGGKVFKDDKKREKLLNGIRDLLERANGYDNFAGMLIHFYRQEIVGLDPREPYNIYLNTEGLTVTDNPILVIDYDDNGKHKVMIMKREELTEALGMKDK